MASPRPIAPIATKRQDAPVLSDPNSTPGNVLSSSPSVPQIPPRSSISSAAASRSAIGSKGRSPSFNDPAFRPTSKPSSESLQRSKYMTSPSARRPSRAGGENFENSEPSVDPPSRAARLGLESPQASGASTPRAAEAGSAALVSEFTDEDKAKVLRRHLVSAEARSARQSPAPGEVDITGGNSESGVSTPLPSGQSTAASGNGSGNVDGDAPGSSGSGSSDETASEFPIPYDAPGGDVT